MQNFVINNFSHINVTIYESKLVPMIYISQNKTLSKQISFIFFSKSSSNTMTVHMLFEKISKGASPSYQTQVLETLEYIWNGSVWEKSSKYDITVTAIYLMNELCYIHGYPPADTTDLEDKQAPGSPPPPDFKPVIYDPSPGEPKNDALMCQICQASFGDMTKVMAHCKKEHKGENVKVTKLTKVCDEESLAPPTIQNNVAYEVTTNPGIDLVNEDASCKKIKIEPEFMDYDGEFEEQEPVLQSKQIELKKSSYSAKKAVKVEKQQPLRKVKAEAIQPGIISNSIYVVSK